MARSYTVESADGSFDAAKYKLGNICHRGHQYAGTGKGLRYIKGGECVVCARERSGRLDPRVATERVQACYRRNGRQSRGKHTAGVRLPVGIGQGQNLERLISLNVLDGERLASVEDVVQLKALETAIRAAGDLPSVARLVWEAQRDHWRECPEDRAAFVAQRARWQHHWRYLTDPAYRIYNRQKSKRRKALERGSIGVHVKPAQIRARFEQFGGCCAYCGAGGDLHIEHLVPIAKGGTHVLGNILPACQRCNFSKRDKDAETWYRAQPWFSERRWRQIRQVLGIGRGDSAQLALL